MSAVDTPDVVHVVVPARDEADSLEHQLVSLRAAVDSLLAAHPEVVVAATLVLDSCTDNSAEILSRHPWVRVVEVELGVVGAVRRTGVDLASLSAPPGAQVWIACTDADSVVPPDWLVHQVRLARQGVDLVVGTVRPDADGIEGRLLAVWHARHVLGEGHPHVHGANLGFSLAAYTAVGGFQPLASGEDVALVHAMRAAGVTWRATARAPVMTSSRREGRAVGGFAAYLVGLVP